MKRISEQKFGRKLLGTAVLSAIALLGVAKSAEAAAVRFGSDYVETPAGGSTFLTFTQQDIPIIPSGQTKNIKFKGRPLDPQNIGNTDTIIERKSNVDPFSSNPSERTTDIEIVALSLVNDGNPGIPYDIFVTLDLDKPSTGAMEIMHQNQDTDDTQGTWNSQFDINFKAFFTPLGDAPDLAPVTLTKTFIASGEGWGHKPGNEVIVDLNTGWSYEPIPGNVISRQPGEQTANCHVNDGPPCAADDFFIRGLTLHDTGNGNGAHTVQPASKVPEPFTILGTLTALGFGVARKRKQLKKA